MRALEALVRVVAAWTVSYHLGLLFHWQFHALLFPFALLSAAALSPWSFDRGEARRYSPSPLVVALAAAAGASTLFARRPNLDDLEFFHAAFAQGWRQPVSVLETVYGPPVPRLSILHALTSYEAACAFVGRLLGADPLIVYHCAAPFAAAAALVLVLWCTYRWLRLDRRAAAAGAAGALLFLIFDGSGRGSFGKMSLVRFWQGKTLLWSLFLPLNYLLLGRFLFRPSRRRWLSLCAAAICGIGLSGSAAFLIPFQFASVGAGYWLAHGRKLRSLKRASWAVLAGLYCYAVAALALSGAAGTVAQAWWAEWPSEWWRNLALVVSGPLVFARDVALLLAAPLAACPRPLAALVALPALALAALAFNPVMGPVVMLLVQPGSYWRLCYLLPVPLCGGMLWAALARRGASRRSAAVAALALGLCAWAASPPVFFAWNGVSWKAPFAPQLPKSELAFVDRALPRLRGRRLLAVNDELACAAALRDPTLTLDAARSASFQLVQAGLPQEAGERTSARAFLERPLKPGSPEGRRRLAAFLRRTRGEVTAVAAAADQLERIETALAADGQEWERAETSGAYALLLKSRKGL